MIEENTSAEIAKRIQWVLRLRGMTQSELARRLGKSDSEICVWLSGRHNFTVSTIEKIEKAIGRDIIRVVGARDEQIR